MKAFALRPPDARVEAAAAALAEGAVAAQGQRHRPARPHEGARRRARPRRRARGRAGPRRDRQARGGGVRIGALATLADLADDADVRAAPARRSPKAAGLAASPQLRHRATVGGNLAQHTRCGYYRHRVVPVLEARRRRLPRPRGRAPCRRRPASSTTRSCASRAPVQPRAGPRLARPRSIAVLGRKGARAIAVRRALGGARARQGLRPRARARRGDRRASSRPRARRRARRLRGGAREGGLRLGAGERGRAPPRRRAAARRAARSGSAPSRPTPWRARRPPRALLSGSRHAEPWPRRSAPPPPRARRRSPGNAYKVQLVKVAVKRARPRGRREVLMDARPGDYARRVARR